MQNLDWDNLRYFLQVVRSGSLSSAATELAVNQTTVSRRISALEGQLGRQLFERSGNHWSVTPIGEKLVGLARTMAEQAHSVERMVVADSQELSGPLRITVADVGTQSLTIPAVRQFSRQYPKVDLEIIATRDYLDLAAREADIALRATDEPPANVVGKRIAQIAYSIYGTREILQQVQTESDQGTIPCITWIGDGRTRPPWIQKSFPNTQRIYRTSELGLMLEMVRQGTGMAQMPCLVGDRDSKLVRIPARYVEPGWGLWVLSHIDLRTTARVRIFRDFLIDELEKQKDLIEGRLKKS